MPGGNRRPLKVAHIIHSLGPGGAESVLTELVEPARRAGIEPIVIGLSDAADNRTAARFRAAGASVYELHAGRYDLRVVRRVRNLLLEHEVDVVHSHLKHADLVGGLAARWVGVPAVSTLHVIEASNGTAAARARVRTAVWARKSLFARVIALSGAQRDWYRELAGGDETVVLMPNGVEEPTPGDPSALREELGIDDGLLAVTVSLLRPEKGHAFLLDAIRRLGTDGPSITFALAGDGQLLESVRREVAADARLRNRVRVLGYRDDVDTLLAAADLVIHPSLADALPTALISALAAGRPVIASDVGGIGDIVTPVCGRLVPAADAPALAAAVADLAADPAKRQRLGAGGRRRYEHHFAADVWAGHLRGLYDMVLAEADSGESVADLTASLPLASDPQGMRSADRVGGTAVSSVAVLSAVALDRPDNGKTVVVNGFMRHLVDRLGAEQVHYLHVGQPLAALPADLEGIVVHEVGRPSRLDMLRGLIVEAGLRRRSLQETFTASPTVAGAVERTLTEVGPELLLVDTLRMAQHARRGGPPTMRRVLYYEDLFSVRYRRMLGVLRKGDADFDPLGQFGGFIPRRWQGLTRMRLTRDLLLRFEAGRVARSERREASGTDVCVLLNEREATQLAAETGRTVSVVPPSLPSREGPLARWSGRPDFAFVGLLSIPHNHDGLIWFLDEVWPLVLRGRPDARLTVIGRDAPVDLCERARRSAGSVELAGFVDDLDEVLGGSAALVSPLRFGSGVKIKTLEALARHLPVVSTTIGAEGIATQSGPGLRIADRPEEFAAALLTMADPDERIIESAGAARTYRRLWAPGVVGAAYDEVFGTTPRVDVALDDERVSRT